MKKLSFVLFALLLAAPVLAAGGRNQAPPDPLAAGLTGPQRLTALVDRVKLEQRELKTVEARFTQQQESSMLAAPEASKGIFSFAAPDKVRWEYSSPSPITVVISGDQMTTWYRDLKRAETLKVGRYSNQIFKYLGASGNLDTLLEYFTVRLKLPEKQGDPYRMELDPKSARIAKRLKSMTLWIDAATFFPRPQVRRARRQQRRVPVQRRPAQRPDPAGPLRAEAPAGSVDPGDRHEPGRGEREGPALRAACP